MASGRQPAGRPFVDQPIGDLHVATQAAHVATRHWQLDPPVLMRRGMNAIFACGPVVLRVGTPTAAPGAALELMALLREVGLRVPVPARADAVVIGDTAVTCWDRIDAVEGPVDWRDVGAMVRRLHEVDPLAVPAAYPVASPVTFPWWDFDALLRETADVIDDRALEGLRTTIDRHGDWTRFDEVVVCHGDVHSGNVIMSVRGPVLIDWDLLCLAPPGWDHAPMLTWADRWGGEPRAYADFAGGYGRSMLDDPTAHALGELRLVAATLMRVRAAQHDPAARPEADRRLQFWRGEPDPPMWRAQ
jgi:aminoglycoside phosphotransferase (APT) family kinase protein